jgi:IS30 family transposase
MSDGTHLRLEERERLAALKAEGLSLGSIAQALGRAASTVSRELRRNALPRGGYLPVHAEGCYPRAATASGGSAKPFSSVTPSSAASSASACSRGGRRSRSPAG